MQAQDFNFRQVEDYSHFNVCFLDVNENMSHFPINNSFYNLKDCNCDIQTLIFFRKFLLRIIFSFYAIICSVLNIQHLFFLHYPK